jgi:RNA polymerase sigma-70 factor, ECF subfamily
VGAAVLPVAPPAAVPAGTGSRAWPYAAGRGARVTSGGWVEQSRGPSGSTVPDQRIRDFVGGEYRQVVATVELVCGSLPTAEDAVQEALARAWEQQARGKVIHSLGAWVTTVALNLARSQMRRWRCERRARDRLIPLQQVLPDAPAAGGEAHAVREALRTLPRRQREVTALRYYLGFDVAETADHLGISPGTVKSLLFRARQSLAVALGETDAGDPEVDHRARA